MHFIEIGDIIVECRSFGSFCRKTCFDKLIHNRLVQPYKIYYRCERARCPSLPYIEIGTEWSSCDHNHAYEVSIRFFLFNSNTRAVHTLLIRAKCSVNRNNSS